MSKGTFEFECAGLKFKGDSVSKQITITLNDNCISVFDIDDLICLMNKLKNTLIEFEKVDDPEPFYCDQLYKEGLNTEQLVNMSNNVCETNYIKRTDEFVIDYYKYGKVSMKEFLDNVVATCYDLDSVESLFDCDYIEIEKDKWAVNGEYLNTLEDNEYFREQLVDHIGKALAEYDEKDLQEFNKQYNLQFKHYNEYLKESGYERS